MPGVIDYGAGAAFIFRVFGQWISNPAKQYANTWEAIALAAGGIGDLDRLCIHLSLFHQMISHSGSRIFKVTVSTWLPDSRPYDPLAFYTVPFNAVGARVAGLGDLLPIETTARLYKSLLAGRNGKAYIRGALGETDTNATSGDPVFANSNFRNDVDAARTSSLLSTHFRNGSDPLQLATITRTGNSIRRIGNVGVEGISNVNTGHRYFDVGAAGDRYSDAPDPGTLTPEAPSALAPLLTDAEVQELFNLWLAENAPPPAP